ncbi:DNA-binding protein HU-beta [Bacteroides luti]|uniref:DNA-binding protein HU-beta n=1 Tax=Bacteroides luti TaxID=1297750 RepID=A0A1M4SKI5_9BACE|nr:HU family DNA-binding protein [Bacteroides luti]SHE32716.1 DNA-binding protein HU-beta [Bacteroides luti]
MNNKEFITELSGRLGYSAKEISDMVSSAVSVVSEQLQEGNTVVVQGFGTFDVKKKLERISVNPATKQRMLVPPKLVINFKPSNVIKDKFK